MIYPEIKTIAAAKELLLNKLQEDLAGYVEVTKLKKHQRIEKFKTDHQSGSIVIHYDASKFTAVEAKNVVTQEREMRFAVLLQTRLEKGDDFRDAMVDRVHTSLSGIRFQAVNKLDKVLTIADEYITPEREEEFEFYSHIVTAIVPAQFCETNYENYQ